jgi:hypothetical protein
MEEKIKTNLELEKNCSKLFKKPNSDILKGVIIGLIIFIVAGLIFGIGVFVGEMKAKFSYRWAEEYHRNFAGPRFGFLAKGKMPPLSDFIEPHGTVGEIIKIDGNNIIVKGRDNVEKTILVDEKTVIKAGFKNIKLSDLKINDIIVVIGSPNDKGQIEGKLIRVFPKMEYLKRENKFL